MRQSALSFWLLPVDAEYLDLAPPQVERICLKLRAKVFYRISRKHQEIWPYIYKPFLDISLWSSSSVSQKEIHKMVHSVNVYDRREAVKLLKDGFDCRKDKEAAWRDLHKLTQDEDSYVRMGAAYALGEVFSQLPNKNRAWKDLIRLAQDKHCSVQWWAASALGVVFGLVPNRDQAWEDLHKLTRDEDRYLRYIAADVLGTVFGLVPDRDQGWKDLIKLAQDDNDDVRWKAANILETVFGLVQDKDRAWEDLIKMAHDEDNYVRSRTSKALGAVFGQVPDKNRAYSDLHRLAQDNYSIVRSSAADALGAVFSQLPDKAHAWEDLHSLAQDEDNNVRSNAADALGAIFGQIQDKDQAWEDLHKLAQDGDRDVRRRTAWALGAVFSQLQDKDRAGEDLHKLTQDEDSYVRWRAADALGAVFSHIPDKDQAWQDLHRLTQDEDKGVREKAAYALGAVFSHIPDKDRAWQDLHKLALDEDSNIRCTSNHSLGKISILKATESEDEFRTYLEEAIESFRKSSDEAKYFNPAAFCLPFYRSLHSLLFTDAPKEEEVQRYLADAEDAIKASESRKALLEAVNNLSKALQEVRNLSINDIILRKRDLKSYTRYCFQTAECLREARTKAPMASKIVDYTLVERSIPIVDRKIKALFRDLETATRKLCKSTKGTDLEAFGRDAYESTKGLNKVDSWIAADQYLERIVPLLKRHCSRIPKEAQEHLKTLIDSQDIASLEQRLYTLESVLLASLVQGENDDLRVKELKGLLDLRLQGIEFAIINMKDSSGNARKELYSLKNQIDGLQIEIESQGLGNKELSESLEERDRAVIDRLIKMREDMIKAVRDTTRLNASKRDVETILKEINNQDRLKKRDVLGIITDIASLAGMALTILL